MPGTETCSAFLFCAKCEGFAPEHGRPGCVAGGRLACRFRLGMRDACRPHRLEACALPRFADTLRPLCLVDVVRADVRGENDVALDIEGHTQTPSTTTA